MPRRACLFIASSAFVAVAAAQTRVPVALPELVGCGKAQAMARSWQAMPAERSAAQEGAQREALAETDLLHCDLQLEVIPTQFNNIYGTNTMTIASRVPGLTQFTFRLADQYTITSAVLNGFTAATVTPVEPHTWVVALDRPYALDEQFTLTISYYGHAASDGFGSIEFSSHSGTPIVYSLSEPYYSFTWWPVKDGALDQPGDNSDKFTLDLSLITPSTLSAASNGLLDSVDTLPGARKRYNWSTGYPLSAYLACFSATNYNSWSLEYEPLAGGTMPILFYIYPEYDTQVNRAAWNLALPMMYTLRDLFGEYPFVDEKYGIYQCQFGGGMEHQTFTAQGTFSEAVTVHELGHQWWGDLVTCKTWNHIWLNEGFATYTESLWAEFKPGGSPAAMRAVMAAKKYTGSGSVFVYTDELGSLYEIFNGSTTYNKGGWVLHMLRHVLGDADFFAALAAYRAQYAFDAATTEDFQAVCEQFYGGTLEWFFDQWIYQQGAPSYTFGWQNTQINGQNYLLLYVNQTQSGSYPRFTMPIDIWVNGTVHKIMNFADPQHYLIPLEAPASTVQFDPEAWVLWASANSTSYVAGPPKIVSTNPPPGAVLPVDTAPQVLAVTFHTGVNTSAAHYTLTGAAHGVLPFTFAYNAADKTATLTFAAPLPPDTYTLTVDDALTAQNSGQALDGEIAAAADPNALPSGDGVPGGNAVLLFEVGGLRGDLNCDGEVNFSDINPFVLLISNLEAWQAAYPDCPAGLGDINEDGVLSLRDINPFIALLSGS